MTIRKCGYSTAHYIYDVRRKTPLEAHVTNKTPLEAHVTYKTPLEAHVIYKTPLEAHVTTQQGHFLQC
jgi:hypothetical protein